MPFVKNMSILLMSVAPQPAIHADQGRSDKDTSKNLIFLPLDIFSYLD
jgi:hypothetical protein